MLDLSWNNFKEELTNREAEIVDLLVMEGCSNKHLATKLKISQRTTEAHLGAIIRKANRYGWENRTQIAIAYWKDQLCYH